MKSEKRIAGRPVTPVLSRELIGEQALELVTARGLEQLTMTNLAKRLKVAASALYNHVANKADVVLLIQDALVSQVSLAGMQRLIDHQATLEEALYDWAVSYRAVFAEYPSLIPTIAVTPVSEAPKTLRMYNTVAQALTGAGIPDEQVIDVIVAFESFLFGSALDVDAPSTIFDTDDVTEDSAWLDRVVKASKATAGDPPANGSSEGTADGVRNRYADPPFQFGLAALIQRTKSLVEA